MQPIYQSIIVLVFVSKVICRADPFYNADGGRFSHEHQDWMNHIPDSQYLHWMSIPGTHDTMALYGSDLIETQSVNLYSQLLAGIRVLDICFVCDTLIMCLQFTTGLFTRKSVLGVSWIFVIRF
jgi:hypothetical protein